MDISSKYENSGFVMYSYKSASEGTFVLMEIFIFRVKVALLGPEVGIRLPHNPWTSIKIFAGIHAVLINIQSE